MAEKHNQKYDPDATVAQPMTGPDPEATVALPVAALDPDATVSGPVVRAEPDPEATFTGPAAKQAADAEPAGRGAAFDPEATVNPAERASFGPEAMAQIPSPGKIRNNPFAPRSLPETIQANLSALGGLNALIAMANPILGAVPQIRRALKHPDPAGLLANLHDQIESLQTSASFAEIPDATVESAVYALCCLLDESAAATPWGGAWIDNGLLKTVRGESGGGEGFFTRLEQISASQNAADADNADLLEFYDVCLALGFEGRYRKTEGGRQALADIRSGLYSVIARRRPRPDGLSERWRSATAQAAAAPALQIAAKVSAHISELQATAASDVKPLAPDKPSFLARVPRRAVWGALAGLVGAAIVFYMLAMRLQDDDAARTSLASSPGTKARAERIAPSPAPAPTPAPLAAHAALAKALGGQPVKITEQAEGITLALLHERQFAVGGAQPAAELRSVIEKIAAALNGIPGPIVVTGHADASPTRNVRYASNSDLSVARARAVTQLMAPKLNAPARLSADGKGSVEPIAAGDTAADRARNRRVTISIVPKP